MAQTQRICIHDVVDFFDELEDPRSPINIKHPLVSVVVIAMMAVLAGANGPTAIAKWAKLKADFLNQALALPNGVPCKDVFRSVLSLLKPEAFQTCFVTWLKCLRASAEAKAAAEGKSVDKPIFAIDGKTSRRSHDRANGLGALHTVSVWASEFGLSLGQVACAEKSNEIIAIPELLRLVDIQGSIITIDAMGTQKAIAAQIVDGKADYVLALKGNQETALRDFVWAKITYRSCNGPGKYENTRRNALSFLGKTCHDETMENPRHLRDTYRYPGLAPAASVQGFPGDSKAIILPLRRRRKKRFAGIVGKRIPPSTTNVLD